MRSTFTDWYNKKMYANQEITDETHYIGQLLDQVKVIAIVGISAKPTRDSYFVGSYLQKAGYTVIPVNPTAEEILGVPCYPDLKSIPVAVDVVNVFRKPQDVPDLIIQALEIKATHIWLQLGVGTHREQEIKAKKAGSTLIQNRCIKVDHQFLIRPNSNN
ncbi:MAG: CoA-binding protein [Balneolales bacterium]